MWIETWKKVQICTTCGKIRYERVLPEIVSGRSPLQCKGPVECEHYLPKDHYQCILKPVNPGAIMFG